ncbi:hypothetical protein [Ekhidna sp.]
MLHKGLIAVFFVSIFFSASSQEVATDYRNTGFLDFNGYYDTREFSTLTLNMLANLKNKFQYFSLTNFEGAKHSSDLGQYYTEQNVRWSIKKNGPFILSTQWVSKSGAKNDNLKFGLMVNTHKLSFVKDLFTRLNFSYALSLYTIQFNEGSPTKLFTQLEHVYKFYPFSKRLKKRAYIAGFADQSFVKRDDGSVNTEWVTEHQLGIEMLKNFYAIVEYRINDFLSSGNYGLGYGLEYKINFAGL